MGKDREKELKRLERERDQLRLQRNEEAQKELQQEVEGQDDDDRYPIPQEVDDNNVDDDISDDSAEEEEVTEIEEDFSGTFYDIQRQQNSADNNQGRKIESPKHTNEKQKKKNSNDSEKGLSKAEERIRGI